MKFSGQSQTFQIESTVQKTTLIDYIWPRSPRNYLRQQIRKRNEGADAVPSSRKTCTRIIMDSDSTSGRTSSSKGSMSYRAPRPNRSSSSRPFSIVRSRWSGSTKGRWTNLQSQYRAVGVNYNQVVKAINSGLPEKKALAALYKLERYTMELVRTNKEILHLSKEFEQKYLRRQ